MFIVWSLYDRAADSKLSYPFESRAERCFEVVWRFVALAAGSWMGASADRSSSMPPKQRRQAPSSSGTSSTSGLSPGLWTPPAPPSRSPGLSPFMAPTLPDGKMEPFDVDGMKLDSRKTTENSQPASPHGDEKAELKTQGPVDDTAGESATRDATSQPSNEGDTPGETSKPADARPSAPNRESSQKGLWGSQPKDAKPPRTGKQMPKRRWTVDQD